MYKKLLMTLIVVLFLSTSAYAGSLGSFTGSAGSGGGGKILEACLDGCCSEAGFHGLRLFFYGASHAHWHYTYPWYYGRYGSITVQENAEPGHQAPFLFHFDLEARVMPDDDNEPNEGPIRGYRFNAKMYTRAFFNFGAYYQQLWEDVEIGEDEHQHIWGAYFTVGGWVSQNVNLDFGFGLVGLGGTGTSEDIGGISFNAEGTFMTLPGLMVRYRWSYTWFEYNHLVDADISIGYILFILEVRAGIWYMDTAGSDPLYGPYLGAALWF